jgi:tyrosine aminotransferase
LSPIELLSYSLGSAHVIDSHGASVIHYDLLPQSGWECDLDQVESILSSHQDATKKVVRGILINNPSNPTGAVYSREHLVKIARLAARYRIPIVSDEIYGDMTLDGRVFHPMANVVKGLGGIVPVITASGIGKQCELYIPLLCHLFYLNRHISKT